MNVWTIVHVRMKLKKGEEYIHHISTNLNRYDRDRYWGDGVMRKGGGLVYVWCIRTVVTVQHLSVNGG